MMWCSKIGRILPQITVNKFEQQKGHLQERAQFMSYLVIKYSRIDSHLKICE